MTQKEEKALTVKGQICAALDLMEKPLNESLSGTGVSVKRFLATAKTAVQTHTDQAGLEAADRNSLYMSIKKAASDGLMPDNKEAALVIYNTKQKDGTWAKQVNYQPMVQGLVKLARKSGEIEKIGAFIVHEKDSFKFTVGTDDIPQHSAPEDEKGNHLWFSDRGDPIGVWAFVKLKSGEYIDPVMLTKERIDRIATRSKIAGNYNPKSGKDWEEWWKKAAIRNILKYAPKSTALESAINDMDEEFDFAEDTVNYEPDPNPISDKPKTETKAAAAVKAKKKTKAKKKEPEPEPEEEDVIDVEAEPVEEEDQDGVEEDDGEEIPV